MSRVLCYMTALFVCFIRLYGASTQKRSYSTELYDCSSKKFIIIAILHNIMETREVINHYTVFNAVPVFRHVAQCVWTDWRTWYSCVDMGPVKCVGTEWQNALSAANLSRNESFSTELASSALTKCSNHRWPESVLYCLVHVKLFVVDLQR